MYLPVKEKDSYILNVDVEMEMWILLLEYFILKLCTYVNTSENTFSMRGNIMSEHLY